MTLTVRLPEGVEQELAEYCVKHGLTGSEAVKWRNTKLSGTEAP